MPQSIDSDIVASRSPALHWLARGGVFQRLFRPRCGPLPIKTAWPLWRTKRTCLRREV